VDKEEVKEIIIEMIPGTLKVIAFVLLYSYFMRLIL